MLHIAGGHRLPHRAAATPGSVGHEEYPAQREDIVLYRYRAESLHGPFSFPPMLKPLREELGMLEDSMTIYRLHTNCTVVKELERGMHVRCAGKLDLKIRGASDIRTA